MKIVEHITLSELYIVENEGERVMIIVRGCETVVEPENYAGSDIHLRVVDISEKLQGKINEWLKEISNGDNRDSQVSK